MGLLDEYGIDTTEAETPSYDMADGIYAGFTKVP